MIFRSEFWTQQKISKTIERDHRHISRIIAHCWNCLPEPDKKVWRDKAAEEKVIHAIKYPGYRFMPVTRAQKPLKRKVKRNGIVELDRCRQVADLLLAGKQGAELETAVKEIDETPAGAGSQEADPNSGRISSVARAERVQNLPRLRDGQNPTFEVDERDDIPAFRSPLLPPTEALEAHDFGHPSPPLNQQGYNPVGTTRLDLHFLETDFDSLACQHR